MVYVDAEVRRRLALGPPPRGPAMSAGRRAAVIAIYVAAGLVSAAAGMGMAVAASRALAGALPDPVRVAVVAAAGAAGAAAVAVPAWWLAALGGADPARPMQSGGATRPSSSLS